MARTDGLAVAIAGGYGNMAVNHGGESDMAPPQPHGCSHCAIAIPPARHRSNFATYCKCAWQHGTISIASLPKIRNQAPAGRTLGSSGTKPGASSNVRGTVPIAGLPNH